MSRRPIRPLAEILPARAKGRNVAAIERENIRQRHIEAAERARKKSASRIWLLASSVMAFSLTVAVSLVNLATEREVANGYGKSATPIISNRADITDRDGRILATNLRTHSLYGQPHEMINPPQVAQQLATIFPEIDADDLLDDFTKRKKFVWIRRRVSPEQQQRVHDLGQPGLYFGPREMRLYPKGQIASHILGGTQFGREGVRSAEIIGSAGVEKYHDAQLRDTLNPQNVSLTIDLRAQSVVSAMLANGVKINNAKGGAAVLMDISTGEIISLASLPDFDPNNRPGLATSGNAASSPLFNRAVQGLYELGSTFKIFTAAQVIDLGLMSPNTMLDTSEALRVGRYRIRDMRNYGDRLSVTDTIVKSSNIGTARMAQAIGIERQKLFLESLGLFEPTGLQLVEAPGSRPLVPKKWSEIHSMTISYGHGISVSPVHLAAAYATIAGGGTKVTPTLVKKDTYPKGPRIISEQSSLSARKMLRQVVERGTASMGEVEGYAVAGKTGTAEKPKPNGRGYDDDKVISSFAGIFPAHDPKYVLVVSLDEPVLRTGLDDYRTAGWTAVPVAGEIVRRVAPLLGLRPSKADDNWSMFPGQVIKKK